MLTRVVTIGVYGFDAATFLRRLQEAEVRLLLDVRQRRGVRGAQYAWANSRRLQAALARAGIDYQHHRELAPTTELRHLQYAEDARNGVGKRNRRLLAPDYARRYITEVLGGVDLARIMAGMDEGPVALFCVERDAEACHRSLIARRLVEQHRCTCEHLTPPGFPWTLTTSPMTPP